MMQRMFAATIITAVEFVGNESSDQFDDNYIRHLTEELAKAASRLSLRTMKGHRVEFSAGALLQSATSSPLR
jgi:hypothetical protein